ncbi:MAG: hydroxymethylbilane synthase [Hyphomicrobiales bacterium]|nr:hydroxymethylbilane synthase [Hyphomicrobiales bacterium]
MPHRLRIGTRGSPLALAQTDAAQRYFTANRSDSPFSDAETVVIKTTGDRVLDRPLADVGGKGLFTKEIDEAMLDGRIDVAVHSVKDLPTWLPDGIVLACVLPRADPRDAFISQHAKSPADLPERAVVGTASLRRQAQLLHQRPDLQIVVLRGNVQTRLRKAGDGTVAATLLAVSGLQRLGLSENITSVLSTQTMLPAVGQGAIGVTCRSGDTSLLEWLASAGDVPTDQQIRAERAMLAVLDGSCRTPIAGLAQVDQADQLRLRGLVARPDGSRVIRGERVGPAIDGPRMGQDLGEELAQRAGDGFFGSG